MVFRAIIFCFMYLGLTCFSAESMGKSTEVIGTEGKKIGTLLLQDGPHGLLFRLSIDKGHLSPGWHGVHFHEVGDCSDHGSIPFMNAKGHINPKHKEHGFLNPKGPHFADLPNIYVHDDGSSHTEFHVFGLSMKDGPYPLLTDAGSALVIHTHADDHHTQPTGESGARVACSVIR
jgi:Cu-Zn family superoxide dismutase